MTFSKEWSLIYKKNLQINNWPFSELISYTIRFSKLNKTKFRVLELGCGSGPNIPFFLSLNAEYFGIDGSTIIINKLKKLNKRLFIIDPNYICNNLEKIYKNKYISGFALDVFENEPLLTETGSPSTDTKAISLSSLTRPLIVAVIF